MSNTHKDLNFEYTDQAPETLVASVGCEARVVWAFKSDDGMELSGLADGEKAAVQTALDRTAFKAGAGSVQELHAPGIDGALYVAGLGKKSDAEARTLRDAAGAVCGRARAAGVRKLGVPTPGCLEPRAEGRALTEGLVLASYVYTAYLSEKEKERRTGTPVETVVYAVGGNEDAVRSGAERGRATANGICAARDLVNMPSQDKRPADLAEQARALAGGNVQCEIWDFERIKAEGMGALIGVGQGSDAPPRLIHLTYKPGGEAKRKLAVVGKGVTFDSGGLSLKPPSAMEDMKIDMAGSAAVLGLFSVLNDLAPPVEIHGIVAAAENMPSGTAIRPGDVLTSMKGITIEVLNTDAEGRLTLADALAFACKQGVEEIIDLATLTGACVVALGEATGLWGRPESFREAVFAASKEAGERTWPMPLMDDYREMLKSTVADIKNVAGRGGGAITAALFLREFVEEGVSWCHMDIAGSASTSKPLPTCPEGGTGTGVGTLIRYIESL